MSLFDLQDVCIVIGSLATLDLPMVVDLIGIYVLKGPYCKWVCLVTLAMSLFDLQDVCIVIGSLATLDLPMVVDLIGIYVLKGPYCTLTTTNWFLQALSVIPRGSWGDTDGGLLFPGVDLIRRSTAAYNSRARIPCESGWSQAPRRQQDPPMSAKLVQTDGGLLFPGVDLIRRSTAAYNSRARIPCESGWSQAPRRQQDPPLSPTHNSSKATFIRKIQIEHAEPLGSLGLNGAGETADEYIPTGGEDL
ncbi:F-box family protein [Dorcoceras hygrometricum]|uniref:F-box family protein n=1 Tax=Dorcoceras hygrometricum TaxID=472368 RepID=A0A2Z7AL98_9LAMI|nr:F-box family protein [Dorcoceras hygrometricum]